MYQHQIEGFHSIINNQIFNHVKSIPAYHKAGKTGLVIPVWFYPESRLLEKHHPRGTSKIQNRTDFRHVGRELGYRPMTADPRGVRMIVYYWSKIQFNAIRHKIHANELAPMLLAGFTNI